MQEQLKNLLYTGIGAAFLTREKLEALREELINQGELSKEEGKHLIDELLNKSQATRDQVELVVVRLLEERVKALSLVTKDEFDTLRRQVEELQVAMNKERDA